MVSLVGSLKRLKGSAYFSRKAACDAASSGETPNTGTPSSLRALHSSRKPQASTVQPGVSSSG